MITSLLANSYYGVCCVFRSMCERISSDSRVGTRRQQIHNTTKYTMTDYQHEHSIAPGERVPAITKPAIMASEVSQYEMPFIA